MPKRRARVEELEPRVLLSSDLAGALALPPAHHAEEERPIVEPLGGAAERVVLHEIVFIDAGIEDWETLVDDLLGRSEEKREIEVVLLDAGRDGLEQITERLARSDAPVDAVHVVSHGTEQGLRLGGTWLDGATLAARGDEVASWRATLSEDADLLLYGCNLAASDEGKALVDQLARLSGADVAASDDLTGAAALGGDWQLEHSTGAIESTTVFSARAQQGLSTVLNGTGIWSDPVAPGPQESDFDGTNFGPEGNLAATGSWRIVVGAEAPTRDEKILIGVDAGGNVSGQVWDGSSWNAFALPDIVTPRSPDLWSFDVKYESVSGNAMLVYSNGTTGAAGISYRTWDGSTWSGPTAIATPLAGEAVQVQLASNPHRDEMTVVVSQSDRQDYALVWDGATWGDPFVMPLGGTSLDVRDINVAYQQQTGQAMVVWGTSSNNMLFATWNGTTWGGGGPILDPGGPSAPVIWSTIAADPNTDRLILGTGTSFNTNWATVWDASGWQPATLLSNNSQNTDRHNVAVGFESTTGEAIAAFTRLNQNEVFYERWTPGVGWSGRFTGPSFSTPLEVLTLAPDPVSDKLMLTVVEQNRQVSFVTWDGDAFGTPQLLETDAGTSRGEPALFLWDQNGGTAPVPVDSIWLSTDSSFPIAPGPWDAGDIVRFGDPGLVLEPGVTQGTATIAFDVERFSAGTDINAIHYVGRDLQIGASSFQLLEGDLLLSISDNSARFLSASTALPVGFTNDLTVFKEDVFIFRPDTPGDYSNGTFALLLDDPTGDHFGGITLIEQDVRVGDADLSAGDFLFLRSNGGQNDSVFLFETTDVGPATAGTARVLLNGQDAGVAFSRDLAAIDVVEQDTIVGGRVLAAGTLLLTFEQAGTAGGLGVNAYDVFALTVTQTTWIAGHGNGLATASLLAEAGDVPFSPAGALDALTLGAPAVPVSNTAPVLTPGAPSLTTITEDETNNTGDTIASIVGTSITDPDGSALFGIAITGLASGNGTWEYDTGSGWTAVGAVSEASALLLRDTDRVRFVPDALNADTASFTFKAWDQTTGTAGALADTSLPGGSSAFSVAQDVASITVTAVNDAPVLGPASPFLNPITEDMVGNSGDLVSDLLVGLVTEVDNGDPQGMAITGTLVPGGNGAWEYSTDGGSTWTAVGSVTNTAALLLRDTDRLRFVPSGQGGVLASITFRAWDQSAGAPGATADTSTNGGVTPFSTGTGIAFINVASVNDAPVLTPGAPSLTPIDEDNLTSAGDTVASLLGGSVTDPDAGDPTGIAISGLGASSGTWEYSIDGGGSWTAVGTVSSSAALLLRDTDLVRFVPDGQNGETATFDFHAWDQSTGVAGTKVDASTVGGITAFSLATDTASIVVASVNDAPVLDNSVGMTLTDVAEDDPNPPGDRVDDIILSAGGDRITDVDLGAVEGIAVVGVDDTNGTWQYSTDGGTVWTAFGAVTNTSAVLLDGNARIRFVPNASYTGPAGLVTFRAWDQTSGTNGQTGVDASVAGGTTAFSTAFGTATLNVLPANDAPVLTPGAPSLPPITEDQIANGGVAISTLLGSSITDVDAGALEGIAITGLSASSGGFEYSLDGGATWIAVPGGVSDGAALLLRATDLVRFVPDGANGETATFDFRAWDQTVGAAGTQVDASVNGGTSAFSVGTDTAQIVVSDVNDAPVLDNTGAMTLTDVGESDPNPPGDTVANILLSAGGDRITDVDLGAIEGIAVVGVDNTNGAWQYSTDGGTIWTSFGAVSNASAVLLDAGAMIRFVPTVGYLGTAGNVVFRAWDQSVGANGQTGVDTTLNGLTTPFSVATETATLSVLPQNLAPVLTPGAPGMTPIDEDAIGNAGDAISAIAGTSITDANVGALEGIAITGSVSGNGRFEYSTDGGITWSAIGVVSETSALLLRDTDRVRFVPDGMNADAGAFTFRAWDQTSGTAGTRADVTVNGGSTAYSTASDAASIVVGALNDAPSLGDAVLPGTAAAPLISPGATIAGLFGAGFFDVDVASAFAGVAIVGNAADPATQGVWEYSSDGGTSWFAIGAVGDDATALVIGAGTQVRFAPVSDFAGPIGLTLRGIDDSYTGVWSSTAGGVESRVTVDASVNGGTAAIASAASSLTTTVLPATPPEQLQPPEPEPEPPPTEPPPTDPPTDPGEPSEPPVVDLPAPGDPTPDPGGPADPPADPGPGAPPVFIATLTGTPDVPEPVPEATERDDRETTAARTSLDVLRNSYLVQSPSASNVLTNLIFRGDRGDFLGQLDELEDDLMSIGSLEAAIVGSSVAVTSGLSVGYVLWLTRGGLLVASLLSSLPAWRLIDPIPILARLGLDGGDEQPEDEESLDSMVNAEGPADDEHRERTASS